MTMGNQHFGEEDQGRQHPPEYRGDLNPDALELEQIAGTAADLKPLNQRLNDIPDDVLERLLVVSQGSRLKQGSAYLDLNSPQVGEFVATGEMTASPPSQLVPKARTDYEAWNFLLEHFGANGNR